MPLRRKRGVERKKKEVGKVVAFCLLIPPSLVVSSIFVLMSCITESQFPKNSALHYSFVTLNPKKRPFPRLCTVNLCICMARRSRVAGICAQCSHSQSQGPALFSAATWLTHAHTLTTQGHVRHGRKVAWIPQFSRSLSTGPSHEYLLMHGAGISR